VLLWDGFPSREELIANRLHGDIEAIRQELGVDSLSYLPMEKLLASAPTEEGNIIAPPVSAATIQYPSTQKQQRTKTINNAPLSYNSNFLSASRIFIVIPMGYCLVSDFPYHRLWTAGIIVIAVVTDLLDGFLARRLHQVNGSRQNSRSTCR